MPVHRGRIADKELETTGTLRVLIVDDDADFRFIARRKMEEAGLHVVGEATDVDAAIETLQTAEVDLVVLDLFFRGQEIDREGISRVRAAAPSRTRMAALSASAGKQAHIEELQQLGVDSFVPKSDLDEFITSLGTQRD